MSSFADLGLDLAYEDYCALAVHDLLHADSLMRQLFGAKQLTGTVTVSPGGTAVTGSGTAFLTEVRAGSWIQIESQVVSVDSVSTDTALTLKTPHADGAVAKAIWQAARIYRTDRDSIPKAVMPFCMVTVGGLPIVQPTPGQYRGSFTIDVIMALERVRHPLDDDEPSWAGVAHHVRNLLQAPRAGAQPAAIRLGVPRFGNACLTLRGDNFAVGTIEIVNGDDAILTAQAFSILYSHEDPETVRASVTKRW